jgi:chromosome segregation ATPase
MICSRKNFCLPRYQDEIASWQSRCGVAEDEASAAATQLEQRSKDHQAAMEGWNTEMDVLRNHITGLEDSNNDLFEQIENLGLEKESVQSELWSLQEEMAALKETQVQSEEVCACFNTNNATSFHVDSFSTCSRKLKMRTRL